MVFAGLFTPAAVQHPFVWLGVGTALLSFLIAYLAVLRSDKRFSKFFALFMIAQGMWAVFDTLLLLVTGLEVMLVLEGLSVASRFTYAFFWLAFVFEYTNTNQFFSRKYLTLTITPIVLLTASNWLSPWYGFAYRNPTSVFSGPATVPVYETTPIFFMGFALMVVYSTIGIAWLVRHSIKAGTRLHRKQGFLVILTGVIVSIGGTVAFFGLHPYPNAPFTTTVFLLGSIPLFWAFYGHQFLSVVPVARREVVKGMNEALLVVDGDEIVIDTNKRFDELFVSDDATVLGKPLTDAFPGDSLFYTESAETEVHKDDLEYTSDGEREFFNVRQSPLFTDENTFLGRVFLFENVTEERRQKLELERQNERLDKFASVVSHDLRNPLSAAIGYTDIVRGQVDDEQHVDTIERNLDRMNSMIEEVLEMSRQGAAVEDPDVVSARDIVETAWSFVDNEDATLVVEGELTIEADRERLQRAFENLMRNSIDHGGKDVTVEIGLKDGMMYLEDTGPGIPEDRWDSLFEFGTTYSDEGAGFGLAIVQSIIQAHGWDINVAEPQHQTGARFEITGVIAASK